VNKKTSSVIKKTISYPLKKILPKEFYDKIKHHYFFFKYPHKDLLKKNLIFKDVGLGRRAFILATGPSINMDNLSVLEGENCYSVSNFFLHKDIEKINPLLHFFVPYHKPLTFKSYIDWMRLADQKLPPKTSIVLGHTSYETVKKYKLFPKREIFYLYCDAKIYPKKKVDLTKTIIQPQSVIQLVLPVLLYMKYSEIYLMGCNHKFDHHFYDKEEDVRRILAPTNKTLSTAESFFHSTKNFSKTHLHYKNIAENYGNSKIINLSRPTPITLFPFSTLKKVFQNIGEQ
jgi:hypothetical protein